MHQVNVTELRQNLATYLEQVRSGEEIQILQHGNVIARLVPEQDSRLAALERLAALRAGSHIGDVTSPVGSLWEVERASP